VLPARAPVKFVFLMTDEEKEACRKICMDLFEKAAQTDCDMLILDEITAAVRLSMVPLGRVLDFLRGKPEKLEVVLTGRDPAAELCALADYISEIKMIKHPYEQGIPAREGIEW
jgi:cob(I)alamin adenosyltransferase